MSSSVQKCFTSIKEQCTILETFKVPFIFSSIRGNRIFFNGTQNAKEVLEAKSFELEEAFEKDIFKMENGNVDIYDKMQAPLSLANANEVRKYARYLIVRDYQKRNVGKTDSKIKYGEQPWEPHSWPADLLSWKSISKNFSEIRKSDIPGNSSINDILKKFIKNALEFQGDDPEKYYDEEVFTFKIEKARKKNRGSEFQVKVTDVRQDTLACTSTPSYPSTLHKSSSPTQNKRTPFPCSSSLTPKTSNTSKNNTSANIENESLESRGGTIDGLERRNTIDRLLQLPTESARRKEREEQEKIKEFVVNREQEAEAHKKEMEAIENIKKLREEGGKKGEQESNELKSLSENLRQNLTHKDIHMIFKANLKYFERIQIGLQSS